MALEFLSQEPITIERLENAMEIVASHIERHIEEDGHSPFCVIFERLEYEHNLLLKKNATYDRARIFLAQRAIRSNHSNLISNDEPDP